MMWTAATSVCCKRPVLCKMPQLILFININITIIFITTINPFLLPFHHSHKNPWHFCSILNQKESVKILGALGKTSPWRWQVNLEFKSKIWKHQWNGMVIKLDLYSWKMRCPHPSSSLYFNLQKLCTLLFVLSNRRRCFGKVSENTWSGARVLGFGFWRHQLLAYDLAGYLTFVSLSCLIHKVGIVICILGRRGKP